MKQYHLKNLDCADCAAKIERAVQKTPGVRFASVNFATETLYLDADQIGEVRQVIQRVEPEVELWAEGDDHSETDHAPNTKLARIIIAVILLIVGLISQGALSGLPYYLVFGAAYLLSGTDVLLQAARNMRNQNWFDESFLMSVATIGAIAIGEFPEAVGVMVFFQIGDYVQHRSVERARRSIKALLEIKAEDANVINGDSLNLLPAAEVKVGSKILVRPGERIPLDGIVIEGASEVDTSSVTGESAPRFFEVEGEVLAGMVNLSGLLQIEVSRPYDQSTIAKMIAMVENAASRKARTEKFITRFARIYSPIVVFLAIGIAFLPPLLIPGANLGEWVHRALVLLVISCPCALVISIPLSYFGGVGGASRRGILVKGANFLDVLADVKTVIFDKTGTLTEGIFQVVDVVPSNGISKDGLLKLAAIVESPSNHPIAKAVKTAYGEAEFLDEIDEYEEIPGYGIIARINGNQFIAGNDTLLHRENVVHEKCEIGGTALHLVKDDLYLGYLHLRDELKPDTKENISALHQNGVENVIMLSGDRKVIAEKIGELAGVDQVYAELLPEDKLSLTEEILEQTKNGTVAFVGDGINDAPALSRADVGIAMGAAGSDAAIEAADVVLMTDSPAKVLEAINIGKRTRMIVRQNIALALIVKMGFIGLGAFGLASMWAAVFADVGVSILAVLNATRVLK